MSVVGRARKRLDAGARGRGSGGQQPALAARVAGLHGAAVADQHEVLILGTGRAIEKTVQLAAWFQRQPAYRIAVRTRTVCVIDDVVIEEDDGEEAPQDSRVRRVSCLEVGVRLR